VGGASNFFLAPVAQAALTQILEWQVPEIEMSLKTITTQIADQAHALGFKVPDAQFRSPHLIGITNPHGISKDLPARLAQEKIFVSIRGQSIRIAPHLYTTAQHVEKLFNALC
jgi:selenocysteine lyase/cysteine desulfurase